MPANLLMFQDFQIILSAGENIRFIHRVRGVVRNLRYDVVMKILEDIQGKS